jgi:D-serine dehydratase
VISTLPAIAPDLLARLQKQTPLLWLNPALGSALPEGSPCTADIDEADARLMRCAGLMAHLFPELESSAGLIESPLTRVKRLQQTMENATESDAAWFIKSDHALPIAGSVKARGGFHEVLAFAEKLALEHNVLAPDSDRRELAGDAARKLFAQYTVSVGSTGNLGLSIGVMAAALGFQSVVHMSTDAKAWKKDRLRRAGVQVVEHAGDYAEAVAAGRAQSLADPKGYFVDDENSLMLFLGYAVAARRLATQLAALNRPVDAAHPLFVYIPCGVGGAPGGITFGLKALFFEHVHCFFAEPAASPCMLVQLAAGETAPVSVYDIGLDNRTEADGLAVGQASHLVSPLMRSQLSGVFTVADAQLYVHLHRVAQTEGVLLEPSAAAGFDGPRWLTHSDPGQAYLRQHGLERHMASATHIVWTTGGSLVPREEHEQFQARGQVLAAQDELA